MADAPAIVINLPGYPFQNLSSTSAFAALRALPSAALVAGQDYAVDGSDAFGDGGGGLFVWAPSSTATDDDATVIKPSDLTSLQAGRWLLGGGKQLKDQIAAVRTELLADLDAFTDSIGGANGADEVGFNSDAPDTIDTNVGSKLRMAPLYFTDYLADETARNSYRAGTLTNATTAWTKFRDALAALATAGYIPCGIIPSGKITTSASPNWAIQDLDLRTEGHVELNYTGTGSGFYMSGLPADGGVGGNAAGVYRCKIGPRLIIRADTAANGFYAKRCHHAELGITVRSAVTNGFNVVSCVNTYWDNPSVSSNEQPLTVAPAVGCLLNGAAGDQTSYCTFMNPTFEGVGTGWVFDYALGNIIIGGTAEGCTTLGMSLTANSANNRFWGHDLEGNPADMTCTGGKGNEFWGCEATTGFSFTGVAFANKVIGGVYQTITLGASTVSNTIGDLSYNRLGTTGTIADTGMGNRVHDITNLGTGAVSDSIPTSRSITVGASPYTYTNTSGNNEWLAADGCTGLSYGRGAFAGPDLGTKGYLLLAPGDKANIFYTTTPTVRVFTF